MVRRARRRALTLLELMVAMALATMVILVVGAAFQLVVGRYADDTGFQLEGDRADRVRSVMQTQLAWLELQEGHAPRRFLGRAQSLEYRTLVGVQDPHLRRATSARYVIESVSDSPPSQRLVYRERGLRPEDLDREMRTGDVVGVSDARAGVITDALTESGQGAVLVSGAKAIRFEYLRIESGQRRWQTVWDDENSAPRAVRVTFEDHTGEMRQWVLPVLATF